MADQTFTRKRGAAKPAEGKPDRKPKRGPEFWDKLVPEFRKHFESGGTMNALAEKHGVHGAVIRAAFARAGLDAKGRPVTRSPIKEEGDALTKVLVGLRKSGVAWYELSVRTGKGTTELQKLLVDAGHGKLVHRVYVGPDGETYGRGEAPPKPEKTGRSGGRKAKKDPSPQA